MVDRRLGRGLDFFLSGGRPQTPPTPPPGAGRETIRPAVDEVLQVDIEALDASPYQPRKNFGENELAELTESVRTSGILQPILVRRRGERLEVIAGERRWRAAKQAGLGKVPVLIRQVTDQESAVFAVVENLQREDLNAIEKASGFRQLLAVLGTQEEVAKRVGLERSTVTNFLRLLDLPEGVQAHVSRGTIAMGHARALLSLADSAAIQACATECIRHGWSVRVLEEKVKELQNLSKGPTEPARAKARPVWLNELEESLVEALGTTVTIRYGRKRSQIVIDCAGREEFERVFQRLKNA